MTEKAIDTTPSSQGNSSKPKTKLDKPKGNQTIVNPQYDEKPDPEAIIPFGSNINESKALTALQRLHRAQAIRRIQPKMKIARERAASRKADDKKIAKRSMRKARDIARDRIAGNSGRKYAEMSTGEKIQIDKRLEDKVALIRRIAKRLVPMVRKAEADRFAAYTHKDMINTDKLPHTKMTVKAKSLKESYDLLDGAVDQKHTSRYGQKIIVGKDGKRRVVPTAITIKSVEEGLLKKSRLSGIPLEALQEVYDRGVDDYDPFKHASKLTEQQYAFNRVNKFLADRSIDTDVAGRFKARVNEEIKGWKNAHSDMAKHRAGSSHTVKTHRLKKDGTRSGITDAVKTHKDADAARAHVANFKKLNPAYADQNTHDIIDITTGKTL